jgi:3-oxoacyl-[acyl-carrier protein] reductase
MERTVMDKRVAVVTGAGRGIGRSIAERLAADGRHVVLVDLAEEGVAEGKAEIERAGGSASTRVADVSDAKAWTATIEDIVGELGRLDILVNNAGITRDNIGLRMSDEEWDSVIRINLTGVFNGMRAAARPMMKGRFGRIVNLGSTSGLVGNAGQANYAAAKAGLIGLTRTFARELGSKGVTANVVAPGFIATEMTAVLPQEIKDRIMSVQQIRRAGLPGDVAAAIAFLSSDDAGFITGQVLAIDGGLTMC